MKTISQYKEDVRALMKKAADIDAQCVNENREPTSAELVLKNEILDTVSEYQDIVKTMERQERMRDSLESPNDPETRPGPQNMIKGSGITMRDKDRFGSLGEQLCAIINAGRPNGKVDPRLYNAAGMNETVPAEGGFLIQQDFATKTYEDIFDNGMIAGKCQKIPISGPSNGTVINGFDETSRISTTAGGVKIYWADEAEEKTTSKPKFRRVELNLKKMIGMCYLTDEMIMDAATIQATVSNAFRLAMDFTLQEAIVNGTGAGQPLGVINSGCLVTVPKETGQPADTLMSENIIKMYSRRFAGLTGNYEWYYNQDIEPQLFMMSAAVGTGGIPVFMPPGGLSDTPYARILGRPAYAIEQCQTLGTEGDIILADFRDGYLLAEKGGLQSDMSIHVRFAYDETALRFVMRVDGQTWRATPLTPNKGANTQSHFISLAERA